MDTRTSYMEITKEKRHEKYLKHKAKIQAHNQKPEIKARRQKLRQIYFQINKEYFRSYALKKKYGISFDLYKAMIEKNNGLCPICGVLLIFDSKEGNAAVVDHNHDSGKVRGVICNKCNRGLGLLVNKDILLKAAEYLKEND